MDFNDELVTYFEEKLTDFMNEVCVRIHMLETAFLNMNSTLYRSKYEKAVNELKSVLVHDQDQQKAKRKDDMAVSFEHYLKNNVPDLYESWKRCKDE